MIVRLHLLVPIAAVALAFAFTVPATFADDMSKGSMIMERIMAFKVQDGLSVTPMLLATADEVIE
jgi:hypothetical protein